MDKIIERSKANTLKAICTRKKLKILNSIISKTNLVETIHQEELTYLLEYKESNHSSETKYKMITIKNLGL